MNKKVNKLYTVFTDAVVISDNVYLNAIEGYDVIDKEQIMTNGDLAIIIGNNNLFGSIAQNEIYKFTNPLTSELWFLSNYFIAYSRGEEYTPEILLVVTKDTCIVKSINVLYNFRSALRKVQNIKIVHSLGLLSNPSQVYLNACWGNYKCDKIKLPVVI